MTVIVHESDADIGVLEGSRVAVIGYGNQGRPWALNLRDAGLDVTVCVRADATRERAIVDGFTVAELDVASSADVVCVLVPDDAIPSLPLRPRSDALVVVASGYTLAFDRFDPACDVGMVAPRMLGPEVRRCYEEGVGFITAFGVHADATGRARGAGARPWPGPSGVCARVRSSSPRPRRRCSTSPSSRRCPPRCGE